MKPTIDVLREARDLITDPAHWTQAALARDKYDRQAFPNSQFAEKFCAVGAVARVTGCNANDEGASRALVALANAAPLADAGPCGVWRLPPTIVNDSYDHATVLKMFDDAMEKVCEDS